MTRTTGTLGVALGALALAAIACSDASLPLGSLQSSEASSAEGNSKANGSGEYLQVLPASLGGGSTIVTLEMNTIIDSDGAARGSFRHTATIQGQSVDFAGTVTCAVVDPVLGRAWIGGIVTENLSTHPSFNGAIHQPGKDVWFRVAERGNGGSGLPDRSTFVGFQGGGGIITSAQYCAAKIWPSEGNAFVSGNLSLK